MRDSFVPSQRTKRWKGVFFGGLFGLLTLVTLNNSKTAQEIQSAPPELSGSYKEVNKAKARPGDPLYYSIVIDNGSASPASDLLMVDYLSTSLSLVTDTYSLYLPLVLSPAYYYLPFVVSPPPPPPPFSGDDGFEVGGQTPTLTNPDRMRDTGMRWVKFQHKWTEGDDPAGLARTIKQGHNQGFRVLLSVTGANTYPASDSINFSALVEYLRGVASLGANSPDAIEVWNEQNIDFEWPAGQISPSSYVHNMLAPAYEAIKSANPNIGVISGALAPTGFDNGHNAWADDRYIRGMASAGAANYTDCVGVHHNAGATSPTVSSGHPGGSHYSWYYRPMVDLYYGAFGGARRLCFTELGYLSGDGFPGVPPNFSWASGTSVSEHAQWLAEATSLSNQNGKVRLLIVYNVDFTFYDPAGDPQAGYAMIRPDGSCPACDTLSTVIPH